MTSSKHSFVRSVAVGLALTAFALPGVAVAQTAPSPMAPMRPGPGAHDAGGARMHAIGRRVALIRGRERAAMLAALTPAHRDLFASVAGRLAADPHPDVRAAAHQLDGALLPGETQAILAAARAARAQMLLAFRSLRPGSTGDTPARRVPMQGRHPQRFQPTAGFLLLRSGLDVPRHAGWMAEHHSN